MEQRRVEYVISYLVKKHWDKVHHDNPSPYLAGAIIAREEQLNDAGVAVDIKSDEEAKRIFFGWINNLPEKLRLDGDILIGTPRLLKRSITEIELD